jgi:predicted deacylase
MTGPPPEQKLADAIIMRFIQLRTRVIDSQQPGPHLLITGGVHGDEFEPMVAIRRLMQRPELRALRGRLTLVPVVNEAALARGTRAAEDELDLARTCPGRADGSITERTAHALSELIRAADYYIDLHTGGTALSVWPLTGYMLHPDSAVLDQQRAMARAFNLPVIWGTDPNLDGRSLSVARDANVPAIYAEYLGGGRCSPAGVEAYVQGCLNVMALLGVLDLPARPSRVETVVEDPRQNSGHMQRCHLAPASGCFEAVVELGQSIAAGQSLGSVVDALGLERQEVLAEQTGRIIVLRTLSSVRKGDSLAVILEVP